MIILVIGSAFSGKSTFVKERFLKDKQYRNFKDVTKCCEIPETNTLLLGYYKMEQPQVGTDSIPRIRDVVLQIEKCKDKYETIVIEGNRICSESFFAYLLKYKNQIKVYFLICSWKTALERMKRTKRWSFKVLRSTFIHSRTASEFCMANGFNVETIFT